MRKIFCYLLLIFITITINPLVVFSQNSVEGIILEPSLPSYVPGASFYDNNGNTSEVKINKFFSEEEKNLSTAIGDLPLFPPYIFSGCHDRAHAAYMLMPDKLKSKSYKVWLFAPSKFTSSIKGTIGLNVITPYAEKVNWEYHVALIFYTNEGKLIYDSALSPKKLINMEQWFSLLKIPPGTIWTVLSGEKYLFNESGIPKFENNGLSHVNNNLINGYFFNYTGLSAENNRIPKNLARDAVGVDLINGKGCQELKNMLMAPNDLLNELQKPKLPKGCESIQQTYLSNLKIWMDILK
jgi:hypothetical protein